MLSTHPKISITKLCYSDRHCEPIGVAISRRPSHARAEGRGYEITRLLLDRVANRIEAMAQRPLHTGGDCFVLRPRSDGFMSVFGYLTILTRLLIRTSSRTDVKRSLYYRSLYDVGYCFVLCPRSDGFVSVFDRPPKY